jgi:hypothetical protein
VLYKGHAVAAAAATSRHIADEALAMIEVEYEVLPVVLDGREAIQADAPILHERLMSLENPHIRPGGLRDDNDPGPGSNLANQFVFEMGDVVQGFSARPTSSLSVSTLQPPSIRAISSPIAPRLFGAPMASSPSGVAARVILPSAIKQPWSWAFQSPR